jgi:cell division protein FtsW (lipid II flippase)
MALSYTSALDRDQRGVATAARTLAAEHLILPATSLVAILAIGLAYAGRVETAPLRDPARASRAVNINTVRDAPALEPALTDAFPHPADRRLAATALFELVSVRRHAGRELPNVGALSEATIAVQTIDGNPLLIDYAVRLSAVRERRVATGSPPPESLPVLTTESLAAIKPSLVVRTRDQIWDQTLLSLALYLAGFYGVFLVWRLRGIEGDVLLLASVHALTAVGFALLVSRADPLRDTVLFARYTTGVAIGLAALGGASLIDFRTGAFLRLSYLPLAAALFLSLLLILFGDGPGSSRAHVNLGPVQPIEAIRLLLAFFLAGYFAQRWELLRQIRSRAIGSRRLPSWLHLPRLEYVLPIVVGTGAALLLFALQRDLGPALFLACVFLAMYAIARARLSMSIVGSALVVAGFAIGYSLNLSDTLTARVRMWQSPWDNAVRGGDQIAQSLWAVATGGLFGTGLGFGDTRYLPAGHTDLVLSAVGEELGFAGLAAIVAIYALVAARGLRIALRAANDYAFFLAAAITLFLTIPVLMMGAGVFGLVPLTGVVTPFLSYGGSAMVANLAALGVLIAIGARSSPAADTTPFVRPTLVLGGTLSAAALALVVVMVGVATVNADEVAVRPHLGIQGDGMRRAQYNPRVMDAARSIPRGTIFDRRGLPIATGAPDLVRGARAQYAKFGVSIDETCVAPVQRCYPLGGAGFHVIGDAASRANWSASNTSYVERDADARLKGFDDTNYRALLPLLRHRYQPDHAAVRAFLARPRDVRLTLDAPLQARVAAILAKYASRSTTGRAAAVVIDADKGTLLAAASYPYPSLDDSGATERVSDAAFLDRARYGLYPPGSTFKLLTAAAALDKGLEAGTITFKCSYLPDGRVGTRIPGWSRPVRDDVLDTRPHGSLRMHDGLVHSCNAYFAQLAVKVGAKGLKEVAARAGISTSHEGSLTRLRDMLPQAGYGQGDVVATPLRMARVAAALAGSGLLRDITWDASRTDASRTERFVSPEAARLLAQYMRDVVVSGTGHTLRGHPMRIAGKTGTAEVAGAPSHSWFTGFAPFDGSPAKIAFAVIVENAGYGAAAAVPMTGEIVSAAAELGLIR